MIVKLQILFEIQLRIFSYKLKQNIRRNNIQESNKCKIKQK
jgi:hypothetical protein